MGLRFALLAWIAVVSAPAVAQEPPPCLDDPKFRALDFALGTWDVFTDGVKTDEVTMAPVLKHCAIHETWRTAQDGSANGLGLFVYSRLLGDWGYLWAADDGTTTFFRGNPVRAGEMRYVTERPLPNGKIRLRHWSLILQPDGTVRELSVGTEDGGKTWTTEYEMFWKNRR